MALASNKRPAIIWIIDGLAYWRMYVSLGIGELKRIVEHSICLAGGTNTSQSEASFQGTSDMKRAVFVGKCDII